jgi:hypothetical protein
MTEKTRRRLAVSVVVLALTLPLETILLQALSTPETSQAVSQWAATLSASELDAAAAQVQSYPFVYRREIMGRLTAARRAEVWCGHIDAYVAAHPELDASARQLLATIRSLMTAETFDRPSADVRSAIAAAADQLVAVIGREPTLDLLYRLGPRDGTFASLEPLRMRMANYVRGVMVAMATTGVDCNCSTDFGCDDSLNCSTSVSCTPDEEWPMCGWFWNDVCDGKCLIIGAK